MTCKRTDRAATSPPKTRCPVTPPTLQQRYFFLSISNSSPFAQDVSSCAINSRTAPLAPSSSLISDTVMPNRDAFDKFSSHRIAVAGRPGRNAAPRCSKIPSKSSTSSGVWRKIFVIDDGETARSSSRRASGAAEADAALRHMCSSWYPVVGSCRVARVGQEETPGALRPLALELDCFFDDDTLLGCFARPVTPGLPLLCSEVKRSSNSVVALAGLISTHGAPASEHDSLHRVAFGEFDSAQGASRRISLEGIARVVVALAPAPRSGAVTPVGPLTAPAPGVGAGRGGLCVAAVVVGVAGTFCSKRATSATVSTVVGQQSGRASSAAFGANGDDAADVALCSRADSNGDGGRRGATVPASVSSSSGNSSTVVLLRATSSIPPPFEEPFAF